MSPQGRDPEELFEHAGYLRRLARGILFDPGQADDVVQRTWIEALRSDRTVTAGAAPSRAWLAGIVRNLSRQTRREETRRAQREQVAARPEAVPSAHEAADRLETLRRLIDAVQSLDEPYRSAISLRFFDDLPPRKIARRLGVPVDTVRTRVRRGLTLLRKRLDGTSGTDRSAFLTALLPLAGPLPLPLGIGLGVGADGALKWSGVIGMGSKAQLGVAAAILIGVSLITWRVVANGATTPNSSEPSLGPVAAEHPVGGSSDALAHEASPSAALDLPRTRTQRALPGSEEPAWVVRGRTRFGDKRPFPNAPVTLTLFEGYRAEGEPARVEHLTSDTYGRFLWRLPEPQGAVYLTVETELRGHVTFGDEALVAHGDAAPDSLILSLYPLDATVTGTVRDREGRPLSGALVRGLKSETTTGENGVYRARVPSMISEVYLRAQAHGHAQQRSPIMTPGPGGEVVLDFALNHELSISGRVSDADGNAVEGAVVASFASEGNEVTTDSEGRYALHHIDGERARFGVYASAPGFVLANAWLDTEPGGSMQHDFVLDRGVRVEGRVTRADGSPVAGARLYIGFSPAAFDRLDAISEDGGRFSFEAVGRGGQTLVAQRSGFAPTRIDFDVAESAAAHEFLELVLEPGSFIAGRVIDEQAQPVGDVSVSVRLDDDYMEGREVTDAEGRFRFDDLPGGSLELEFYAKNIVRKRVPLDELDREDLEVVVVGAGGIAGRVVDGLTGAPIDSFRIRFVEPLTEDGDSELGSYSSSWSQGRQFTGTDGEWGTKNEELPPGAVTGIEVIAEGYARTTATRVVVTTDPDPDDLVLRMFVGSSVRGRVVEAVTGAPVAGALVKRYTNYDPLRYWNEGETRDAIWARTDANGYFELTDVPGESMSLAVGHPEWKSTYDGPFDVPVGAAGPFRLIEMRRGGVIDGVLLSPQGEPRPGEFVHLSANGMAEGPEYRSQEATTDEQGRFRFEHLSDGLYQVSHALRIEGRSIYSHSQGARVEGDQELLLELKPRGTGTVRGRLDFDGELPKHVMVSAMRPKGYAEAHPEQDRFGGWVSTFAFNGSFALGGLEAGPWKIQVTETNFETRTALVGSAETELALGGEAEVWIHVSERSY